MRGGGENTRKRKLPVPCLIVTGDRHHQATSTSHQCHLSQLPVERCHLRQLPVKRRHLPQLPVKRRHLPQLPLKRRHLPQLPLKRRHLPQIPLKRWLQRGVSLYRSRNSMNKASWRARKAVPSAKGKFVEVFSSIFKKLAPNTKRIHSSEHSLGPSIQKET